MQTEIVRCSCGQILATRTGSCVFIKWRGRKVRIKGLQTVEVICERCKKKTEIKKNAQKQIDNHNIL